MFSRSQDERVPPAGQGTAGGAGAGHGTGHGVTGQRSVLAADLRVTGIVASEGLIEVHGIIDGEVTAQSVLIGHDGEVSGKVTAGQVEVRGRIKGEVSTVRLTLRAAAQLDADVMAEVLLIESGAQVQGNFSRPVPQLPPPEAAEPEPPAAEPPAAEPPAEDPPTA
ncbi:bactofilin family protein [Ruixingdingia sedimenti]|uniref:Polymer-forming cytoskeletal protein n=1 Tax=Ruixingdingia sedimenti TaxID=3073604 RepID=A0ABU1FEN9_9RHOB|nr:polymer-forming cytoskeletal protein [Xinfangfangia sp. LG-4]MDR5655018.1 polymer-forming cytoskeletal protein [Xinfangfangia sp. LG-4]